MSFARQQILATVLLMLPRFLCRHSSSFSRQQILATVLLMLQSAAAQPAAEQIEFFESKIRPLFVEHCYSCHSEKAEKLKGGLRLDTPEALMKGGSSGAAIVRGQPDASLLIEAVRYTDPD